MFTTVLSDAAQAALAVLGESGLVQHAYLAGGSALALHYGHRYSIDFDFFSRQLFDPKKMSRKLQKVGPFVEEVAKGISLNGIFRNVKMSYFQYEYPLIEKTKRFLNVQVAHPHDIAAMKLVAIGDRGTKKDYVDLYELTHQGITLEAMFDLYDKKYHLLEANRYAIFKSLTYFDEAEGEDMPKMIRSLSWDEVKRFFTAEAMRLAKAYLEG